MEKARGILPLRGNREELPNVLMDGLGFEIAKELLMMGWQGGG